MDASYVRAQDKNATVCQVTRPLEGVENEWQKFDMQAERQKGVTMTSRIKFFEHDGYVYSKKTTGQAVSDALRALFYLPLYTLFCKGILPLARRLNGNTEALRVREHKITIGGHEFTVRTILPVRALIAFVAHLALGLLNLLFPLICLPHYCWTVNRLNAKLERWVNGHTDEDIRTKTANSRHQECPYVFLCMQPLFKIMKDTPIIKEGEEDTVYLHTLPEEMRYAASRALFTGNYETKITKKVARRV